MLYCTLLYYNMLFYIAFFSKNNIPYDIYMCVFWIWEWISYLWKFWNIHAEGEKDGILWKIQFESEIEKLKGNWTGGWCVKRQCYTANV